MKAIRLVKTCVLIIAIHLICSFCDGLTGTILHLQVANKLYSMPCIAQEIEDFARDMLFTVVDTSCDAQGLDVEASMSGGGQVFNILG